MTDVNFKVQKFAGAHYCKLLSPLRALEWIYIDGLKDHMGIKDKVMFSNNLEDLDGLEVLLI